LGRKVGTVEKVKGWKWGAGSVRDTMESTRKEWITGRRGIWQIVGRALTSAN